MKKLALTLCFFSGLFCFSQTAWDARDQPINGRITISECNQSDVEVEVFGHLKKVGFFQRTLRSTILLQGRRADGIAEDIGTRSISVDQLYHATDNENRKRRSWGWFPEYKVNFDNTDGKYVEFMAVITETNVNGLYRKFYSWFSLYGYAKKKILPNMNLTTINGSILQNHQIDYDQPTMINFDNDYCGCADVFFSLQKVNQWWGALDSEKKDWFVRPLSSGSDYCSYDGSRNRKYEYTLNEISQMVGITLEPENYYRLKIALAVGPWNAIDKIIYIGDRSNVFNREMTINEKINSEETLPVSLKNKNLNILKKSEILVYPNPSKGLFSISLNNKYEPTHVAVYTINGTLLYQKRVLKNMEGVIDLDLSDKPSGIYFLQITTDTQTLTKRLVKN